MAVERFIPVSRPSLGDAEARAAARAIASGWVTQGPEVEAFEREFAAFVGSPHACAVSSGTAALHLALLAVGVKPGDEVITVSHSFIATASSITYTGAVPVFVDVLEETLNIDPAAVEAAITPKTRAILAVHQLGMPCDLASLVPLARRHGLALVEDAACAVGSAIRLEGGWEAIGRPHGDIACFSFHPRKLLTTGDGGMITTARPEWDRACRALRHHGMSVSDRMRHEGRQVAFETYDLIGFNYRLTDIQAAVGRSQLPGLAGLIERRRQQVRRYVDQLESVAGIRCPVEPPWARTNWQSVWVRLPDGRDQRAVMQHMLDRGVATRRGVMCAHREPAYVSGPLRRGEGWRVAGALTVGERAQDRTIILPLYEGLLEADQDRVVESLRTACR
jgi:dTDP-4-amino-4,6-dideoxygalactose transaminase